MTLPKTGSFLTALRAIAFCSAAAIA